MDRKLVVLGIPWDIDTDGLKEYMSKYGELEDCIVMKERSSGRSRGFGYVTFLSEEDAKHVLTVEHSLGNRMLEVKVATPKEEMRVPSKKVTRIFVARIPQSVTKSTFQSHFEKYGEITDLYMPKDQGSTSHRGIGFITYAKSESVDNLMSESHELGGSAVVVDRATPKEDEGKGLGGRERERVHQHQHQHQHHHHHQGGGGGGYGAYNAYITAATRYAALGAPTMYDHPPPSVLYPRGGGPGKKIFVGRLPQEATIEALRQYFGRFGRILDVYLPRDPKRSGHRGFAFVTFAEDGVADRVSRRSHEICGHQVAIDTATPVEDGGTSGGGGGGNEYTQQGGPMRAYVGARMYAPPNLDFEDWNYGIGSARPSRSEWRYRPY